MKNIISLQGSSLGRPPPGAIDLFIRHFINLMWGVNSTLAKRRLLAAPRGKILPACNFTQELKRQFSKRKTVIGKGRAGGRTSKQACARTRFRSADSPRHPPRAQEKRGPALSVGGSSQIFRGRSPLKNRTTSHQLLMSFRREISRKRL